MNFRVSRLDQRAALVVWMLFAGQSAYAQLDMLQRCSAIAADTERLACFDALAETLLPSPAETPESGLVVAPVDAIGTEAVTVIPEAGENGQAAINTSQPVPVAGNNIASFGLEQQVITASGPDMMTASVVSASRSRLGTWTVGFDNGQVWQQVGSDRFSIREGESYVIERASRNSFLMKRQGFNRSIRVSRVR